MRLEENFYKEEIRCDYLVSEKMKKIWAVQLDLLNKLLEVCQKHDIKVFAFAGTLLGAVRHKGFIPWDDDVDVCMERKEYERFLEVCKDEFPHPYFLQTALTDQRCFCGYARLRNSNTTGIICLSNSPRYNNGIYIDIFVLDGYLGNTFKFKIQKFQRNFTETLLKSYNYNFNTINRYQKFVWAFKFMQKCIRLVPYKKYFNAYNKILKRYNGKTNKLTFLTHPDYLLHKYWIYTHTLSEIQYLDFESIKVPVPEDYDSVLRNTYGNYMEFPPVEKRGQWHSGVITYEPDIPYKEYMTKERGYLDD